MRVCAPALILSRSAMISGSSEQLLEQHQNEQRRLKLKILDSKKNAAGIPVKRNLREQIRFYTTSTLALFSMGFGASLLFLVPLYVDPALSTLASDFVEPATWCTTTRREDVVGINNCTWSSCREGCTSDMYKCLHVYVTYVEDVNATLGLAGNLTAGQLANVTAELPQSEEAMLLINIKGCGYPPTVTCSLFAERYGVEGAVYPCHYSRVNRTVVLTEYNHGSQITVLVHFFAIPFAITVVSSVALCVLHCECHCQNDSTRKARMARHRRRARANYSDGTEDDEGDEEYVDDIPEEGAGSVFDDGRSRRSGRGSSGRVDAAIGMPGRYRPPYVENISDSSISTRVDMLTPAIEVYRPPL